MDHLLEMTLNQFLKWEGIVSTGGEAKNLIMSGLIQVNKITEKRRGRKLMPGDIVSFNNEDFIVSEIRHSGP